MLRLEIYSFSFHKTSRHELGLQHGGGYEFDCRCLNNPGRQERFRFCTGKDQEVAGLLEEDDKLGPFLDHCFGLVRLSIEHYLARNFDSLAVGFGCTGGQHRSVYCAERCAEEFKAYENVEVVLSHKQFHSFDWLGRS
jgi:RNase adaptor protein for sRNA GlmZ degradation